MNVQTVAQFRRELVDHLVELGHRLDNTGGDVELMKRLITERKAVMQAQQAVRALMLASTPASAVTD
jgi:hypothetical protein